MGRPHNRGSGRRVAKRTTAPGTAPSAPADLARHANKCRVCNHADRLAIEFDFLNWRNPWDIIESYHLRNLSTIYRHAHATGLFSRRRLNLRFALERIVERVGEVPVTAGAVIRAVRAITRINDAGEWIEPPTRVVISRAEPPAPPRSVCPERSPSAVQAVQPPLFDAALLEEPSHSLAPTEEQGAAKGEQPRDPLENFPFALTPEAAQAVRGRLLSIANENDSREESDD